MGVDLNKKFWAISANPSKTFNNYQDAENAAKRAIDTKNCYGQSASTYYVMEGVAVVRQPLPSAEVTQLSAATASTAS